MQRPDFTIGNNKSFFKLITVCFLVFIIGINSFAQYKGAPVKKDRLIKALQIQTIADRRHRDDHQPKRCGFSSDGRNRKSPDRRRSASRSYQCRRRKSAFFKREFCQFKTAEKIFVEKLRRTSRSGDLFI